MAWCRRIALAAAVCLATGAPLRAQEEDKPTVKPVPTFLGDIAPTAPTAELAKLQAEYDQVRTRLQSAAAAKTSEADRRAVEADLRREKSAFSARFLALAKASTNRQVTLAALAWILAHDISDSKPGEEALGMLAKDFLIDDELTAITKLLIDWSPRPVADAFFVKAANSPNRRVRGHAMYHHALFLKGKVDLARVLSNPEQTARRAAAEVAFGKPLADELRSATPATIKQTQDRMEGLLDRVVKEFRDVSSFRGSLADVARNELFEIRNLAVGMKAPNFGGHDLNGQSMQLSDYDGKIVVLSFWASWCPKCMQLVGQERELAGKLANYPFALVGINSDSDRKTAQQAASDEQMTWRSWFDGDKSAGPIASQWNILEWPVFYVLDAQRVIRFRFKSLSANGLKDTVGPAVEQLLKESGAQPVAAAPAESGSNTWLWLLLAGGVLCIAAFVVRLFIGRTPGAVKI